MKIIQISRVEANKRPFDFVDLAASLPEHTFVWAGGGSLLSKCQALAANLPNVKFIGPVSEEEKSRLYEDSDVYVSTSSFEGFNITIGEALLHAIPVVAYDLPVYHGLGYSDFIHLAALGSNRAASVDNFTQSLRDTLNSYDSAAQMAEDGKRFVQKFYSLDSVRNTAEATFSRISGPDSKILAVMLDSPSVGGGRIAFRQLLYVLQGRFAMTLVSTRGSTEAQFPRLSEEIRIDGDRAFSSMLLPLYALRALKKSHYDVLLTHMGLHTFLLLPLSQIYHATSVIYVTDRLSLREQVGFSAGLARRADAFLIWLLNWALLRLFQRVVSISGYTSDAIAETSGVDKRRISVVPFALYPT